MSLVKIYTGVGSRETPPKVLTLMRAFAKYLGERGWTLRSGAAQGADTAFELGAVDAGSPREIFLPWPSFGQQERSQELETGNVTFLEQPAPWTEARLREALKLVPDAEGHEGLGRDDEEQHWHRLSQGARKLHQRNVHQIYGEVYDPSKVTHIVICWTPAGKWKGGTATALKLAHLEGVPVLNLGRSGTFDRVWNMAPESLEDFIVGMRYH